MNKFDVLLNWKRACLHNVRLLDVGLGDDNQAALSVELGGQEAHFLGGAVFADWYRNDIGKVGYLQRSLDTRDLYDRFTFSPYLDQSLRRVPELDLPSHSADGRVMETVGWRCDARPEGFRAPATVIPGENGSFVADETVALSLRIPPEFIMECRQVQKTPEEVLRGFIGDAAGLMNYLANPRADGYCSNGSDERTYAESWLDRAYGMERVPLEKLAVEDQEREETDATAVELLDYLGDFHERGGSTDEFLEAVRALVDRKALGGSGDTGDA